MIYITFATLVVIIVFALVKYNQLQRKAEADRLKRIQIKNTLKRISIVEGVLYSDYDTLFSPQCRFILLSTIKRMHTSIHELGYRQSVQDIKAINDEINTVLEGHIDIDNSTLFNADDTTMRGALLTITHAQKLLEQEKNKVSEKAAMLIAMEIDKLSTFKNTIRINSAFKHAQNLHHEGCPQRALESYEYLIKNINHIKGSSLAYNAILQDANIAIDSIKHNNPESDKKNLLEAAIDDIQEEHSDGINIDEIFNNTKKKRYIT